MSIPLIEHPEMLFWDVDTQVDFALPGGKLYAPGAETIIPNLERLTQYALRHGILVIASTDAHREDDAEFAQWPVHCVVGTPGQQKLEPTQLSPCYVVPAVSAPLPDDLRQFRQIVVQKRSVDVFTNPNIDELLAKLGKPKVTLYGLVTDVCVDLAVQGLLDRGLQVSVVVDAMSALKQKAGEKALARWKAQGAQLVSTDEVVEERKT